MGPRAGLECAGCRRSTELYKGWLYQCLRCRGSVHQHCAITARRGLWMWLRGPGEARCPACGGQLRTGA